MSKDPRYYGTKSGKIVKAITIDTKRKWREIKSATGFSEMELNEHLRLLFQDNVLIKQDNEYFIVPALEEEYLNYYKVDIQTSSVKIDVRRKIPPFKASLKDVVYIILIVSIIVVANLLYSPQISQLNTRNENLLTDIESNQMIIVQLQNDITFLKNDLEKKSENIKFLLTEKASLEAQVSSEQLQIIELKFEIVEKENYITELDSKISDLQAQLEAIKSDPDSSDISFVDISFSRIEDTSDILQTWIDRADTSIYVMVMLITQNELADSLIEAHDRGIEVTVIIDDEWVSALGSDYQRLKDAGVDIRNDERAGLMHHKVMIIDDYIVVVGSYNWSASAEDSNDENVLIIKSEKVADEYLDEFDRLWGQTRPSEPPSLPPNPPPTSQYALTISISGSGSTHPSQGEYSYDEDFAVQVTAYPASGWDLDYWMLNGDNVGKQNPYVVTMNKDHELTAVFEEEASPPPTEGEVVINEVEANPPGNDNYGNVYEWIELYNPSSVTVDIGGWKVTTTHGVTVTITIPQGTSLKPGKFYIVERGQQWIDNEDEKIVLKDSYGDVMDSSKTIHDPDNDDNSWQRSPDGSSNWTFKSNTKGSSN